MDLVKEILAGHSKFNSERVALLIGDNKQSLLNLIRLVMGEDQEIARKAAWIMRSCHDLHPDNISPYFGNLIGHLDKHRKVHDAVKRNILGVLKSSQIPRKFSGKLLDICFGFLESGLESVAVKAFSMDIISMLAVDEPDLLRELSLIIEDQMPYSTPGIKSKAKKILVKHHFSR